MSEKPAVSEDSIRDLVQAGSSPEARARFGAFLGISKPVSQKVMTRVLTEPAYALQLVEAAGLPDRLEPLLEDISASLPKKISATDTELLAHAAQAFSRWAKTGFAWVDDERYHARLATCHACEHFGAAPAERLIYRLVGRGRAICARCGCVVTRKARLPTENCPEPDMVHPNLSRWGEPRAR